MQIIQSLPFPRHSGMKHIKEYILLEDLFLEQWTVPAKTTIKLVTSTNFGLVVLPVDCQDKRGFTIPQRLFRY